MFAHYRLPKRCLNDYNMCSHIQIHTHTPILYFSFYTYGGHIEGVTGEVLDQHMIAEQTTVYHHPVYRVLLNMLMKNCSATDSCSVVYLFIFSIWLEIPTYIGIHGAVYIPSRSQCIKKKNCKYLHFNYIFWTIVMDIMLLKRYFSHLLNSQ